MRSSVGLGATPPKLPECRFLLAPFATNSQAQVAAHAHQQDRLVVGEHRPIGIQAQVGLQAIAIRLDEFRQRDAARLLVAFEDHLHADGKLAVQLAPERDGVQHREVLALVVAGAAAPDAIAVDHGLEGLRAPAFLLLVGGIDVVVAVEEPRELRVLRAHLGVDDRVAGGRCAPRSRSPSPRGASSGTRPGPRCPSPVRLTEAMRTESRSVRTSASERSLDGGFDHARRDRAPSASGIERRAPAARGRRRAFLPPSPCAASSRWTTAPSRSRWRPHISPH